MTPKVQDQGHRAADKELAKLMKRLQRSYRQASLNLQEKINAYMERFEKEDAAMRALYDSGELSHEDYMSWRCKKIAGTKQWKRMREQLATDLVNADKIAAKMIRDALPEIYAENHNYGTYEIERDLQMSTSYTLYNRDAVARLLKGNPDLLPNQPNVNVPKDERWNRQHIQSAVLQGILTGESMQKIAGRMQDVAEMDARAAMRNARTAVTGAENAGKLDSMRRAQGLGVELKKLWLATRDSRTRDSHVMLDGEMVEIDEPFSNGCMYPGDPDGAPAEVYNCRCAMRSKVAGADPYSPDLSRNQRLGEMSYDEWKDAHTSKHYPLESENEGLLFIPFSRAEDVRSTLENNNVRRVDVKTYEDIPSEQEIITKICGVDRTNGSCASLSFAYAGNKSGFEVLDFRGGKSEEIFSSNQTLNALASLPGVKGCVVKNVNDFDAAHELMKKMKEGSEYCLCVGKHVAIIKKVGRRYNYLELQSSICNGWMPLTETALKKRFKCQKTHTVYRQKIEVSSQLIEISSFSSNLEFQDLLSYINTEPDQQKKGIRRNVR